MTAAPAEDLVARVRKSIAASGVPERVEDLATLAVVARILEPSPNTPRPRRKQPKQTHDPEPSTEGSATTPAQLSSGVDRPETGL